MAGAKLDNQIRTFIVQSLACFDAPSAVVKAVQDEYGITITRQAVETYDPNKRAGRDLAQKWRAIFEETRAAFLEDTSKIGISHRAVRLRTLQRMAEKAETIGNMVLASSLLEQAAKEMGIVIREAAEAGQHPRDTARAIVGKVDPATGKREGGFIGLDSRRQGVFGKVMAGMTTPEGIRDLVTVPRDGTPPFVTLESVNQATKQRILRAYCAGEAASAADIAISRKQLRNKLLKDRGDTIGRTEALNGLRAGRHEGFLQLVDSGAVRRDQVRIRWQATLDGRVRDSHRHLHDQTIRLGEFFNPAPGVFMAFPGDLEHSPGNPKGLAANVIQCRCLAVYRIKSDLLKD